MENLVFGNDEVIIMTEEMRVNKQGSICFPVLYSVKGYNCGELIPFDFLKKEEKERLRYFKTQI